MDEPSARLRYLLRLTSMTTAEELELKHMQGYISLADLRRMQTWPKLPVTGYHDRHYGAAYVIRHLSNNLLFWGNTPQGQGVVWYNIQHPNSGTPAIIVFRPDTAIILPNSGRLVRVGRAIRLYPTSHRNEG